MKESIRLGKSLEIMPIASESFGVRSSAFFINSQGISILVDPSVSLAPRRKGCPPHPIELLTAALTRKVLLHLSKKANVVIVSHYHGDHYTIPWKRFYEYSDYSIFEQTYFEPSESIQTISWEVQSPGKEKKYFHNTSRLIIAKSINRVSWNQKKRAKAFWEYSLPKNVVRSEGDGNTFYQEDYGLKIESIGGIPHGCDSKRGNIAMTRIIDEKTGNNIILSSDVEGPCDPFVVEKIQEAYPEIVFLDGPAFYHPKFEHHLEDQIIQNVKAIMDIGDQIYIDHHFNRSSDRDEYCKEKYGIVIPDFARAIGLESINLESKRKELWNTYPSKEIDARKAWGLVSTSSPLVSSFDLNAKVLKYLNKFFQY